MENFFSIRTVSWERNRVKLVDQTKLPGKLVFLYVSTPEEMAHAIKNMVVRGAPAIGVAAAMGVVLSVVNSRVKTKEEMLSRAKNAEAMLRNTRPTAVNLFWGIQRIMNRIQSLMHEDIETIKKTLIEEVKKMEEEDVEVNKQLGKIGSSLIDSGDTILTQCNAGALATVGYGTALGIVRAAVEQGKIVRVLIPETRPQLQGSRLTAFELKRDGIECRLIPDTSVGYSMQIGLVDKVIVGADRVTVDGYVFNKIGTYQIAVLSEKHSIPFYVAAPLSSFDLQNTHDKVVIEERSPEEIVKIKGRRVAPRGVPVFNPAFDKTPPGYVDSIVTERGIITRPLETNLPDFLNKHVGTRKGN